METYSTLIVIIISLGMASLTRNKVFKNWLVSKIEKSINNLQIYPSVSANFKLTESKYFSKQQSLKEIVSSLVSLNEFKIRAVRQNAVIYHRATKLPNDLIEQLYAINYFHKISEVDKSILLNYNTLSKVVEFTLKQLIINNEFDSTIESILKDTGYTWDKDAKILKHDSINSIQISKNNNQSRVNEAMCHIVRDWSDKFDIERKPLIDYIQKSLNNCQVDEDTLILVPGSGCGRIAYEISLKFPQASVDSIEYSPLMYLCNEFVLGGTEEIDISPFYQYYSGQQGTRNQTRKYHINLNTFKKPDNLTVHFGDFCCYKPDKKYKSIVICSAFFIDTAENLFEYFSSIENLSKFSNMPLHWINIGPLKYGTKPLVQLTFGELTKLRNIRGWKDHSNEVNIKDLNGYLTDYESLYQGFYGLVKFHSELKK